MNKLTADLGRFLANIKYEQLPEEALKLVRNAFADTVAVIMVGINEPVVDIVRRTIVEVGGRRDARACLSAVYCAGPDAALLNGTAAHTLDYDDQSLSGHPSAVLVPAILAEGETLGSSGREMATAYVAGYEVWSELWRRDRDYHRKGWHPTSVFGVMAAAAAAAVLHKLPAERAAAALALAASHAGGLGSNFGTMTKPYHAGMAARNGLISTRLVAAGMSAAADALEHPQGFLSAYSTENAPDRDSPVNLGKEWYLVKHSLLIKRYPCCYFMHRSFESTAKMLAGRNIKADDVESVEVTMGKGQITVLCNARPQTGLEAKFSGHFAMAAAVILGRMGVPVFTDEIVQRPDIQAFYAKVKLIGVDEFDPRDPVYSPTESVQVRLKSGETLNTGPIAFIRGHANDPLSTEELWAKFAECTEHTHKKAEARALFDVLQKIDSLKSARDLPTCTTIFTS